jgi:hypothetical protein
MLVVCKQCGRHAKAGGACFFCHASLDARPPIDPMRRPHRSRVATFGAIAALGMACGARTDLGGDVEEESTDAAEECHAPMTVYGASFIDAGCHPLKHVDASTAPDAFVPPSDASTNDVTFVPPYGAHFPDDSDDAAKP